MKIKIFFMGVILLVNSILFNSCQNETNPLNDRFSKEIVESIRNTKQIKLYQVESSFHDEYKIGKLIRILTNEECKKIKSLMLQKSSYIFDVDKRCLFLPEYAFIFDDSKKTEVLINISGKQIAFPALSIDKKINIDPIYDEILKIININQ